MKQVFKPIGIAAAVAAASAGFVNVAHSQDPVVANNALGDLAIVPYYTVNGDWITGIHIVNTSDFTQVVKFRFRRAPDSIDALDFNIVMSPKDVYAGFLSDDENGVISWAADDTTCTVPETTNGRLTMPDIYREGADTGYVEIIAMGQISVTSPIGEASKHSGTTAATPLTPASCAAVRSNFFQNRVDVTTGTTVQTDLLDYDNDKLTFDTVTNEYEDSEDALKVSYFIRDNATGVEFGDNAAHISGFLTQPAVTNQEFGYLSGDLEGFDFPDLDGGSPVAIGSPFEDRERFEELRNNEVLGVGTLINEWTANPSNGAALDWVVTMPGQYLMLNRPLYLRALDDAEDGSDTTDTRCSRPGTFGAQPPTLANLQSPAVNNYLCDYRDLPVTASFGDGPWNREEFAAIAPGGNLTVSPALPGARPSVRFDKEANVITFGGNSVLGVSDYDVSADLGQPFGWLTLSLTSSLGTAVCEWDPSTNGGSSNTLIDGMTCTSTDPAGRVPVLGFAAWARNVAANPDASYGRIVAHSFTSN